MQAGLRELEGLWTGQTATNFQQLILQWRATQQYADAEQSNARMFTT